MFSQKHCVNPELSLIPTKTVCSQLHEWPQCSCPCGRQYIGPPFVPLHSRPFVAFTLFLCPLSLLLLLFSIYWFSLVHFVQQTLTTFFSPPTLSPLLPSQVGSTRCWSVTRSSTWGWWKTWGWGGPASLTGGAMRSSFRGDQILVPVWYNHMKVYVWPLSSGQLSR